MKIISTSLRYAINFSAGPRLSNRVAFTVRATIKMQVKKGGQAIKSIHCAI